MVSWTTAKKFVSQADIERLACIGWTMLDAQGVNETHWQTIGPQIKGVKLASLKRTIWLIGKKTKEAGLKTEEAAEDASGGGQAKPAKDGKGGAKRKAADHDDEEALNGDGDGEARKKVTKRATKEKEKIGGEEAVASGEDDATHDGPVKAEAKDDDWLV